MKTTVKVTAAQSIVVEPCKVGGVFLNVNSGGEVFPLLLTQDQCGALLFAIEQAAEAARIANERDTRAA